MRKPDLIVGFMSRQNAMRTLVFLEPLCKATCRAHPACVWGPGNECAETSES